MARIDTYSFGSISVDGHRYKGDLIIYPDRVQSDWWRKESHTLQLEDIPNVLAEPPEVFVVGQGNPGRMQIAPPVAETLAKLDVRLIVAPTKTACSEFNRLAETGVRVVAALHLTC